MKFMSGFPHIWATILALVTPVDKLKNKTMIFIFRSLDILPGISNKFIFPFWQEELTQHGMNNKIIYCVA